MRVRAREADAVALDAERAEHDAERLVLALEHRALLDVQLEVGDGALELARGVGCAVEVDAVVGERVRQGHAVAIGQAAHRVRVERACRGARAEQAAPEPRPLLVGPVDELEAEGGAAPAPARA